MEVAGRVAPAHAAALEDVDLPALGAAEVAAGETAEGPADRHVGAPEVQEVLLRLVGRGDDDALPRERSPAQLRHAEEPLQREEARDAAPPILDAVPLE